MLCALMITPLHAQELPSLAQVYAKHFMFGFGGLNDKVVRAGLAQAGSPIHPSSHSKAISWASIVFTQPKCIPKKGSIDGAIASP